MNTIMTASAFALSLLVSGLFAAPHPVAAASAGLSVSGGLAHSVGWPSSSSGCRSWQAAGSSRTGR